MRYERKVIVLSGLLAVLLLAWVAGIVFSPERRAARSESAHLLAGKAADVAAIVIARPGKAAIELSKSGASWTLVDGTARLPVQAARVSSFLDELAGLSRLRLVARAKDAWPSFQLDDAQAKRATLKDASGKVLADLYLGGYGPTGSELYIRRGGSDSSYTAETGIASYMGYDPPAWLDLRLFGEFKEADVQSFSVKSSLALPEGGKADLDYSLRREAQGWKAGAAGIDAEEASALLRSILGLQGEDFAASPPADAFSKVEARIRLELGSGRSLALEVGHAAGKDRFYARTSEGSLVFILSSFSLRACLKNLKDLTKK